MRKLLSLVLLLTAAIAVHAQDFNVSQTTVEGKHGKLATTIRLPRDIKGRVPVVIFCHGFGGSGGGPLFDTPADALAKRGIAVVTFDFQGHGRSEGRFEDMTVPGEINDVEHIIDFVKAQTWADTKRIGLTGHSMGCVVAAMTAGTHPKDIRALALLAPATILREDCIRGNTFGAMYDPLNPPAFINAGGHKLGSDFIKTAFRLPIFTTAAAWKGKACLVHGTGDRIAPFTASEHFLELWPKSEMHVIEKADHGFSRLEKDVATILVDYFAKAFKVK